MREVWYFVKGRFHIFRLVGRRYVPRERSTLIRSIDLEEIAAIVARSDENRQTETVRAYRRTLRRRK